MVSDEFVTEEFFEQKYRESNVAEFFRRNMHMLGYSGPVRSMTTIVHEFVTNSLDACEEANVMPEIITEVKQLGDRDYIISVEDNGSGVPEAFIPKLLGTMLAGTKFHRYIQSRGQQGIGAVGAIMFSHITSGIPIKIVTSTGNGKIVTAVMDIDIKKNKPLIFEMTSVKGKWRGTKIVARFKDVVYQKGEQGVYEYIRRTATANPHAKMTLAEPDGNLVEFKNSVNKLPPKPQEMQPHPMGVSADDLRILALASDQRKLSTFLVKSFSRLSSQKVSEIMKLTPGLDYSMDPKSLTHQQAEQIVAAFKKVRFIAPSTEGLVPISEETIEKSLNEILKPQFYSVVTRSPAIYRGGIPFQIEVGLAYEGQAGRSKGDNTASAEVMRFANRVPLIFDAGGCAITQAIKSIEWRRYHIGDFENSPITVLVNIISSHIPYTSAGKQAIADESEIMVELRFALMDAGRKLKSHLSGVRRDRLKAERRAIFEKYIPEVAEALSKLSETASPKEIIRHLEKFIKDKTKAREIEESGEVNGQTD